MQIVNIADCGPVASDSRDNVGMELEIQHSIVKTTPTQVGYPPPGLRRRIALIAVGAMALLPTTVLVSRMSSNSSGPTPVAFAEAPRDVGADRVDEYTATSVTSPQSTTVANCGLICAPEVAALWNAVKTSAPDTDDHIAALAESIRSSLGAIDDAIVDAVSAMR